MGGFGGKGYTPFRCTGFQVDIYLEIKDTKTQQVLWGLVVDTCILVKSSTKLISTISKAKFIYVNSLFF